MIDYPHSYLVGRPMCKRILDLLKHHGFADVTADHNECNAYNGYPLLPDGVTVWALPELAPGRSRDSWVVIGGDETHPHSPVGYNVHFVYSADELADIIEHIDDY